MRSQDTGAVLAWADGTFAGDRALVAAAKRLCEQGKPVYLTPTGPEVSASAEDPVAAFAVARFLLAGRLSWEGDLPSAPFLDALGVDGDAGEVVH